MTTSIIKSVTDSDESLTALLQRHVRNKMNRNLIDHPPVPALSCILNGNHLAQIPLDPSTGAFLQSLAFPEMDYRFNDVVEAVQGTYDWLAHHDAYKKWLSAEGLLWVKGKPGSGKSTFMRHTIDHSRKQITGTGGILLSFFFFTAAEQSTREPLSDSVGPSCINFSAKHPPPSKISSSYSETV